MMSVMSDLAVQDHYLNLLERMLTRYGFEGSHQRLTLPQRTYALYLWNLLEAEVSDRHVMLVEATEFDASKREEGRDWPVDAETMVGLKRLRNVRKCVESVIAEGIAGDLIETGSWRGGVTIYMRAILAAHGVTDRVVWVADSFQGLPPPDAANPADLDSLLHTRNELAISVETVKANFRKYDLLDDQVRFLEGFFEDTLPNSPVGPLAVLRLDGDMYSSTMVALDSLYDKLSVGGYVIIDDFGAIPACRKAVEDFRGRRSITDEVQRIDYTGVYWRKS
jgi:O-methyltransferase